MKLSETDLRQLNTDCVLGLQPAHKDRLLLMLIDDLRQARERLEANSNNSSRPPRSDVPWLSASPTEPQTTTPQESSTEGVNKADTDAKTKTPTPSVTV